MKQISLLIALLVSSSFSFAEDMVVEKELQAYFLRFNFVRTDLEAEHKEESSTAGFEALGRTVKLSENSLDFSFGREFLRLWPISLSLYIHIRGNIGDGGKEDAGSSESIDYKESLSGYGAGGGGSLNFNVRILETRTQLFLGVQTTRQKNKYFLRYSDDDSEERSTEIESNETATNIQSSFGIRVFNLYNGYTFNIAVHMNDYSSDSIEYKATQGSDTEYKLTTGPEFTRGNTAYSLGFGGTF